MGKYRHLPPEAVAEQALANLVSRIPQMTQNYASAMNEFAADPSRQAAYKMKVAAWVAAMRDPSVRAAISQAIQQAKSRYLGKAQLVRETVVSKIQG